jgi:hypothetical protein
LPEHECADHVATTWPNVAVDAMDYNEAVGFEHVFVRCAMRLNRPVWVTLARIYR